MTSRLTQWNPCGLQGRSVGIPRAWAREFVDYIFSVVDVHFSVAFYFPVDPKVAVHEGVGGKLVPFNSVAGDACLAVAASGHVPSTRSSPEALRFALWVGCSCLHGPSSMQWQSRQFDPRDSAASCATAPQYVRIRILCSR